MNIFRPALFVFAVALLLFTGCKTEPYAVLPEMTGRWQLVEIIRDGNSLNSDGHRHTGDYFSFTEDYKLTYDDPAVPGTEAAGDWQYALDNIYPDSNAAYTGGTGYLLGKLTYSSISLEEKLYWVELKEENYNGCTWISFYWNDIKYYLKKER